MLRAARRLVGNIRTLKRDMPAFLHWSRKMKDDPLFRLELVDEGLRPRRGSDVSDRERRIEISRRIIAAYRQAASDLESRSAVYKVSNEWVPIFRRPLMPLLQALGEGDPARLVDLLDNFFRNSTSSGLIGLATDMSVSFFQARPGKFLKTMYLIDSVHRWRLLKELLPNVQPRDLHVPDVGNPYGFFVDREFIRAGADYQYYYASQVDDLLGRETAHSTVLELGGGIGGFAYYLMRLRDAGFTYINFDLPEILCISTYQLMSMFPEKSFLLYGESSDLSSGALEKYDAVLLPSFTIEGFDTDSVDVSFNSYSLAEMSAEAIANYSAHMGRVTRKAVMHVNHIVGTSISADQFTFGGSKFRLQARKRAMWNYGRNLNCDEYEFLFLRSGG